MGIYSIQKAARQTGSAVTLHDMTIRPMPVDMKHAQTRKKPSIQ